MPVQEPVLGEPDMPSSVGTTMFASALESNAADVWFQRLENMSLLLEKNRKAGGYNPVKIAILDTGIDGNHPYRRGIKGYKDFVEGKKQEVDKTGHGTNGVHLIFKVLPEAHIYVGRVFDNEKANNTTPDLMAEAIKYATKTWKVDIIAMSSGFKDDHPGMLQAILAANSDRVLVFAAASNYGNMEEIAFPARMQGNVICMFSSNGLVKPSLRFNPAPSPKLPYNFCILGEDVQKVPFPRSMERGRDSGTSIATFIAAGIAALVIDFSLQQDCRERIENHDHLKTVAGMSAVFEKMAKYEGGYHCIAPWNVLECSRAPMSSWDDVKKREYICGTVFRALTS